MDRLRNVISAVKKVESVITDSRFVAAAAHLQSLWAEDHPLVHEDYGVLQSVGNVVDAIAHGNHPTEYEHWLSSTELLAVRNDNPLEIGWREILLSINEKVISGTKGISVPLTAYSIANGTINNGQAAVMERRDPRVIQEMLWKNPSLLPKEALTYQLEKYAYNIMIIFNHNRIEGFPQCRDGTEKDVVTLKTTFENYHFLVEEHKDNTKKQVFDKLQTCAQYNFSDVGCIAIVILSHGESGGLIHAKDDYYHESELKAVFHKSKNKTLFGKPVLLLIQACRTDSLTTDGRSGTSERQTRDMGDYSLPIQADMLLLHSTYEGEISVRDEKNGTWFIQELCRAIREFDHEDLQSIIVRMLSSIAYYKVYKRKDGNSMVIFKQMPVCTTTLTRKLFLKRNLTDDIKPDEPTNSTKELSEDRTKHEEPSSSGMDLSVDGSEQLANSYTDLSADKLEEPSYSSRDLSVNLTKPDDATKSSTKHSTNRIELYQIEECD